MEKRKSFLVQKTNKKLHSTIEINSYLIGKKCIVIANLGGHNYGPIGSEFTITQGNASTTSLSSGIPGGNSIQFTEFSVIEFSTKENIQAEIKELKADKKRIDSDIKNLNLKLDFIKENNLEIFDEDQFKAYKTLVLVEDPTLSRIEKAKLIAELVK